MRLPPQVNGKLQALEEFARRALESQAVWTGVSPKGTVKADGLDGSSAQLFWSTRQRAEEILERPFARRRELRIVRMPLPEFLDRVLVALAASQVLVGVDWGTDRKGWVFEADPVRTELGRLIRLRAN